MQNAVNQVLENWKGNKKMPLEEAVTIPWLGKKAHWYELIKCNGLEERP